MTTHDLPAVHPEQDPVDPACVVWHVPPQMIPLGRVVAAPGALGEMLIDGTLDGGLVARGLVWLWLGPGRSWRDLGPAVRVGLHAAVVEPSGWVVEPDAARVLRRVSDYVLAGSLAGYIASHGGEIRVESVVDDTVEVTLSGACAHCPAAGITLHDRLEQAIQEHYPALAAVRQRNPARSGRRLPWPGLRKAG